MKEADATASRPELTFAPHIPRVHDRTDVQTCQEWHVKVHRFARANCYYVAGLDLV